MAQDPWKVIVPLTALAVLFAWSVGAGLVGLAVIGLWIGKIAACEALQRRASARRTRELLAQGLGGAALSEDSVVHTADGIQGIGASPEAGRFVFHSREGTEVYEAAAVLEAKASRLAQGDFEVAVSVAGRVTGKPYWHSVIVKRRHAERWAQAVRPLLGTRLTVSGLD